MFLNRGGNSNSNTNYGSSTSSGSLSTSIAAGTSHGGSGSGSGTLTSKKAQPTIGIGNSYGGYSSYSGPNSHSHSHSNKGTRGLKRCSRSVQLISVIFVVTAALVFSAFYFLAALVFDSVSVPDSTGGSGNHGHSHGFGIGVQSLSANGGPGDGDGDVDGAAGDVSIASKPKIRFVNNRNVHRDNSDTDLASSVRSRPQQHLRTSERAAVGGSLLTPATQVVHQDHEPKLQSSQPISSQQVIPVLPNPRDTGSSSDRDASVIQSTLDIKPVAVGEPSPIAPDSGDLTMKSDRFDPAIGHKDTRSKENIELERLQNARLAEIRAFEELSKGIGTENLPQNGNGIDPGDHTGNNGSMDSPLFDRLKKAPIEQLEPPQQRDPLQPLQPPDQPLPDLQTPPLPIAISIAQPMSINEQNSVSNQLVSDLSDSSKDKAVAEAETDEHALPRIQLPPNDPQWAVVSAELKRLEALQQLQKQQEEVAAHHGNGNANHDVRATRKPTTGTHTYEKVDVCSEESDPFRDIPVDLFLPPDSSSAGDLTKWHKAVRAMLAGMSALRIGGEPLRQRIAEESKKLEGLRRQMFCKYVAN